AVRARTDGSPAARAGSQVARRDGHGYLYRARHSSAAGRGNPAEARTGRAPRRRLALHTSADCQHRVRDGSARLPARACDFLKGNTGILVFRKISYEFLLPPVLALDPSIALDNMRNLHTALMCSTKTKFSSGGGAQTGCRCWWTPSWSTSVKAR